MSADRPRFPKDRHEILQGAVTSDFRNIARALTALSAMNPNHGVIDSLFDSKNLALEAVQVREGIRMLSNLLYASFGLIPRTPQESSYFIPLGFQTSNIYVSPFADFEVGYGYGLASTPTCEVYDIRLSPGQTVQVGDSQGYKLEASELDKDGKRVVSVTEINSSVNHHAELTIAGIGDEAVLITCERGEIGPAMVSTHTLGNESFSINQQAEIGSRFASATVNLTDAHVNTARLSLSNNFNYRLSLSDGNGTNLVSVTGELAVEHENGKGDYFTVDIPHEPASHLRRNTSTEFTIPFLH